MTRSKKPIGPINICLHLCVTATENIPSLWSSSEELLKLAIAKDRQTRDPVSSRKACRDVLHFLTRRYGDIQKIVSPINEATKHILERASLDVFSSQSSHIALQPGLIVPPQMTQIGWSSQALCVRELARQACILAIPSGWKQGNLRALESVMMEISVFYHMASYTLQSKETILQQKEKMEENHKDHVSAEEWHQWNNLVRDKMSIMSSADESLRDLCTTLSMQTILQTNNPPAKPMIAVSSKRKLFLTSLKSQKRLTTNRRNGDDVPRRDKDVIEKTSPAQKRVLPIATMREFDSVPAESMDDSPEPLTTHRDESVEETPSPAAAPAPGAAEPAPPAAPVVAVEEPLHHAKPPPAGSPPAAPSAAQADGKRTSAASPQAQASTSSGGSRPAAIVNAPTETDQPKIATAEISPSSLAGSLSLKFGPRNQDGAVPKPTPPTQITPTSLTSPSSFTFDSSHHGELPYTSMPPPAASQPKAHGSAPTDLQDVRVEVSPTPNSGEAGALFGPADTSMQSLDDCPTLDENSDVGYVFDGSIADDIPSGIMLAPPAGEPAVTEPAEPARKRGKGKRAVSKGKSSPQSFKTIDDIPDNAYYFMCPATGCGKCSLWSFKKKDLTDALEQGMALLPPDALNRRQIDNNDFQRNVASKLLQKPGYNGMKDHIKTCSKWIAHIGGPLQEMPEGAKVPKLREDHTPPLFHDRRIVKKKNGLHNLTRKEKKQRDNEKQKKERQACKFLVDTIALNWTQDVKDFFEVRLGILESHIPRKGFMFEDDNDYDTARNAGYSVHDAATFEGGEENEEDEEGEEGEEGGGVTENNAHAI